MTIEELKTSLTEKIQKGENDLKAIQEQFVLGSGMIAAWKDVLTSLDVPVDIPSIDVVDQSE